MKTAHKILLPLILLLCLVPVVLPGLAQNAPEDSLRPESAELAPPVARPPERLRVVSFNVHYARDLELLTRSLKSNPALQGADIFLIQEIESYAAEGASRARKLAEALGLNYVYAPARTTLTGGTHGLAILSRYPLTEIEVLALPRNDLGSRTRRRIALGATVEAAGRRLRLYNLHLDTRINIEERLAQLAPVLEAARRQPLDAVVIGGDFNTNPFRWAWAAVCPGSALTRRRRLISPWKDWGSERRWSKAAPPRDGNCGRFGWTRSTSAGLRPRTGTLSVTWTSPTTSPSGSISPGRPRLPRPLLRLSSRSLRCA